MSTAVEIANIIQARGGIVPNYYYDLLNHVIKILAGRMYYRNSDIISDELDVTVAAAGAYGELPDDFWGLISEPYIEGYTWMLKPSTGKALEISYVSSGQPSYYRVKNANIYIYPSTSAEIVIKGDYFAKPATITEPEGVLPYNEQFDIAIIEGIFMLIQGKSLLEIEYYLNTTVDLYLSKRDKKSPVQLPGGINWGEQ